MYAVAMGDARMRMGIAALRFAMAAAMLAAIVSTYVLSAQHRGAPPNPFNFFGFFTIQSNLLGIVAFTVSAVVLVRGGPAPGWLPSFRGATTAYLMVVGVVYVTLLAPLGAEGGVTEPWANWVLHYLSPVVIAVDWLLVADRPALAWRQLWLVLVYPAVWIVVVLIRGATDGWVPYPFLNPENGAGSIALVCLGIALTILAAGALATVLSRADLSKWTRRVRRNLR